VRILASSGVVRGMTWRLPPLARSVATQPLPNCSSQIASDLLDDSIADTQVWARWHSAKRWSPRRPWLTSASPTALTPNIPIPSCNTTVTILMVTCLRSARYHWCRPMIIAKIDIFPLRIPFKSGSTSDAAAWGDKGLPAADSLLVRVTTDEGLEGWDEAFGFQGSVVGKIGDRGTHRAALHWPGRNANRSSHARIAEETARFRARRTVWSMACRRWTSLSGISRARSANAPVHRLLGGGRADLPSYASLNRFSSPGLISAETRRALDAGFRSLKLHATELSAIRAAREEVGPDVELMLDVNCAWTLNEARTKRKNSRGTAEAMVEWRYFDLEAQIYGGMLLSERGRILVPQGPGLGMEPDPTRDSYLFEGLDQPNAGGLNHMSASALFLSRLQFVWVIGRHIILPAFTAGAGAVESNASMCSAPSCPGEDPHESHDKAGGE